MANNRFNKQVTPKGYKMGGRVKKMGGGMMKRPMYKDGSPKLKSQKQAAQDQPTRQKSKPIIIMLDIGKDGKNIFKVVESKAKGGRAGLKGGGSLKPVQPNQKGLKKLPTEVRNKMGFMKKGGKVK